VNTREEMQRMMAAAAAAAGAVPTIEAIGDMARKRLEGYAKDRPR
jgi:hypothetical protein